MSSTVRSIGWPPATVRRRGAARQLRPGHAPRASPEAVAKSLVDHLDTAFRPDIEGLRAIAVVAVIVYHAHFFGLTGGFVGVDVFFVLSGFLITRLILGELARTGSVDLPHFWARRARRLLPASALTAVVTVIAARLMLPPLTQGLIVPDVVGAATFTANFVFANRLGGYFGAQLGASTPSPFLHFWSLAVEEQFYLLWPPLLVALTRRPRQYRRLLLTTIVGLGLAGFVIAAWLTPRQPSWAFYLLPARMGELLAGALLAVLGRQLATAIPVGLRAAMAWAGVALIAWSCWSLDDAVPWPGVTVLVPVVATMAVIVGGDAPLGWGPGRWATLAPLPWIGRHSYALYLWHWPVLVLADATWGPLDWMQRVCAIAVAVGLSAVSMQFVEDPLRHSRALAAVAGRSLAVGAAMCLLVLVAAWGLRQSLPALDGGEAAATPQLLALDPPATLEPLSTTTVVAPPTTATTPLVAPSFVEATTMPTVAATPDPTTTLEPTTTVEPTTTPLPTTAAWPAPAPPQGVLGELTASLQQALTAASAPAPLPSNLRPSLGQARERSLPYRDGCVNVGVNAKLQPCEFGVPGAAQTVVLYGDSHAVQWFEPLQQIALDRGLRLVLLIKGGCPVTDVVVPTPVLRHTCPPYRDAAIAWIQANQPAVVVAANSYTQYTDAPEVWAAGAEATMARLDAVAEHVVVIGDNPASTGDPPACLSEHPADVSACHAARVDAVRTDRIGGELAAATAHGAAYVDTSDWFCTPTICPAVLGDLLVLRDETHITPPMAEFLRPLLDAALAPTLDAATI